MTAADDRVLESESLTNYLALLLLAQVHVSLGTPVALVSQSNVIRLWEVSLNRDTMHQDPRTSSASSEHSPVDSTPIYEVGSHDRTFSFPSGRTTDLKVSGIPLPLYDLRSRSFHTERQIRGSYRLALHRRHPTSWSNYSIRRQS